MPALAVKACPWNSLLAQTWCWGCFHFERGKCSWVSVCSPLEANGPRALWGWGFSSDLGGKVPWTSSSVKMFAFFFSDCVALQFTDVLMISAIFNAWCFSTGEVLLHLPRHSEGICQIRRGLSQVDQTIHGHQRHQQNQVCYRCWLREVPRTRNLLPSRGKSRE